VHLLSKVQSLLATNDLLINVNKYLRMRDLFFVRTRSFVARLAKKIYSAPNGKCQLPPHCEMSAFVKPTSSCKLCAFKFALLFIRYDCIDIFVCHAGTIYHASCVCICVCLCTVYTDLSNFSKKKVCIMMKKIFS
jgi:hypothetical protein